MLDKPKMNMDSDHYQEKYLRNLFSFKEEEPSQEKKQKLSTVVRFHPRITPYTMAFFINNRR